ncbi:MAG: hypothetical protein JXB60_08515 [Candidatus Cloacimonetes bacterium]|nr:hypothetical protein [Candidatus Cloacimonadota bacterium]
MKSSKFSFVSSVSFILILILLFVNSILLAEDEKVDLLNTKISIDAEDGSIPHIISTMAKLSGCNIVLAMESGTTERMETEEKKITIHLKDVPIEQAIALVVKSIGLSYRLVGEKTFLVGERDRIEEEIGERSYIIYLNYVDVGKITKALEIMPGQSVAIEGQNAILIRANPETFAEINSKIEEIDVPQKQIEIRARLIEISVNDAKKFGVDWSRLNKLTTIIAEDPVTQSGLGLPFNYDETNIESPHGELTDYGVLPEQQYFQKMDNWEDVGKFSRQLTAFDITIDWLLQNNAAKLLTDTRITALNGEEAEIHIGEVVPYVVFDEDNNVQVEREDVGIILRIKPNVNSDGQITTHIEPEVSSVIELVQGYVPRTKVRRITSTVTVPDGNRIVVGGLLNSMITTQTNKVPLLGDIPLLGKLFQHKYEVIENTDLIVEITPRVVGFEDQNVEFELDERLERELIKRK